MFPSPSLGPPLLSLSWSPSLLCGIPEEDSEDGAAGETGAADFEELDDGEEDELDELEPPQPATMSATVTNAKLASQRIDAGLLFAFMMTPFFRRWPSEHRQRQRRDRVVHAAWHVEFLLDEDPPAGESFPAAGVWSCKWVRGRWRHWG
jgi:hypothetical protein